MFPHCSFWCVSLSWSSLGQIDHCWFTGSLFWIVYSRVCTSIPQHALICFWSVHWDRCPLGVQILSFRFDELTRSVQWAVLSCLALRRWFLNRCQCIIILMRQTPARRTWSCFILCCPMTLRNDWSYRNNCEHVYSMSPMAPAEDVWKATYLLISITGLVWLSCLLQIVRIHDCFQWDEWRSLI